MHGQQTIVKRTTWHRLPGATAAEVSDLNMAMVAQAKVGVESKAWTGVTLVDGVLIRIRVKGA